MQLPARFPSRARCKATLHKCHSHDSTALHCTRPQIGRPANTGQDSSFVVGVGRALYTLSPHALCARTRDRHGHRDLQSRTAAESCLLVPVLLILADGSSGELNMHVGGMVHEIFSSRQSLRSLGCDTAVWSIERNSLERWTRMLLRQSSQRMRRHRECYEYLRARLSKAFVVTT